MASTTLLQKNSFPGNGVIRIIHQSIPASSDSPAGILLLPLPEDISFGVASSWESFSEGNLVDFVNKGKDSIPVVGGVGAFTYETYARATNSNAYISSFSHQTWKGTSPLEFVIKITLSAYESAKKDVMDKLEMLTRLSLPQGNRDAVSEGIPGKIEGAAVGAVRIFDANASLITSPPRDIAIHLGPNISIPAVVIPSVNVSFETRCDAKGDFIFATADITIKSSYTPNSGMFVFNSFQSDEEIQAQQDKFLNS